MTGNKRNINMSVKLDQVGADVQLTVYVQPGARSNRLVGEHGGMLKVAVTSPPEKGKANAALIEFLADLFKISKSRITIIAGHGNRQKKVVIAQETVAAVSEAIALHASAEK